MAKVIEVEGLAKVFPPATRAVDGISFSVNEGEIFGFLGPNGAGKTTVIRMLTTIASITEGTAAVAGHDVVREPGAVRRAIGIVPQEVTLDNELKGVENLLFAARLHHVPRGAARERARELLALVELEDFADKRVSSYSGGMKRRLQLVTALIHRPSVVFLDEPTVGLDIQTRTKLWEYIRRLSRDEGLSVFLTTHYLEEADYLSERVAIMDHGAIKVSGSPAELKESLHGDVLTVEVTDGGDLTESLRAVEGVREVARLGGVYRMKLPRVETALPAIVAKIAASGLQIRTTSFSKPTLDQVFLEVTGKSMRDAEETINGRSAGRKGHGS